MSKAKNRPDFEASGFFALRTPLLSLDELDRWSAGLEAPSATGDDLPGALERDRSRLRRRLRRRIASPEVREALFVASPDLIRGLEAWRRDPTNKKGKRAEQAVVRYFLRMASRSTPFGLFAGGSVGSIDAQTRLRLGARNEYRRHTRLDMEYLAALCEALEADPELRRRLRYTANPTLVPRGERLRYIEGRTDGTSRAYQLAAIVASEPIREVLRLAGGGATVSELAGGLVRTDAEGDLELGEAEEFVHELIDHQLLVSDLAPLVTGPEAVEGLIDQLAEMPPGSAAAEHLSRVRTALEEIDETGLGVEPERYRTVLRTLRELPGRVNPSHLFQVDMSKPAPEASLGAAVVEEVRRGVEVLRRWAPAAWEDPLADFRRDFHERYEGRGAVPLLEVLDEELGVGFESAAAPGSGASPLLDGLRILPRASETKTAWGRRELLLLQKLERAAERGETAIEVTKEELEPDHGEDPEPLPTTFQVSLRIAAAADKEVDEGRFQILLTGCTGPSGARLIGRFCHGDPVLHREVEKHLRREEEEAPEAIFAEVVHLPEGRAGNILARPVLRRYEIPFLGRSGAPAERQIPVSDLLVRVAGERVELFSRSLDREVIPRLTTAHNYSHRSLGLYRFLCALQAQGDRQRPRIRDGLGWEWGAFRSARFLPRVTSGRAVLCRAWWRVERDEIEAWSRGSADESFAALQRWRLERRLPRQAFLIDGDNELLVDFDNVLSVETFVSVVKRRRRLELVEPFPLPERAPVRGPEGRFGHEIVIPMVHRRPPRPAVPAAREHGVTHAFEPGSEWLYVKLYTGAAETDQVLRRVVAPVAREALRSGAADRWFFIRYGDSAWHLRVRFHGDPHRLVEQVLPRLRDAAEPWIADGRIWRFVLDTYQRETSRYGGEHGIRLAEEVFQADSEAVVAILDAFAEEGELIPLWQVALIGIDRLLADLRLEPEERLRWLRRWQESFAREHGVGPFLRRQLADRLRRERPALERLLAAAAAGRLEGAAFAALEHRSQRLAAACEELRRRQEEGLLSVSTGALVTSFVHMFCNRLLRADARAHEMVLYDFLARLTASRMAREAKHATPSSARTGGPS